MSGYGTWERAAAKESARIETFRIGYPPLRHTRRRGPFPPGRHLSTGGATKDEAMLQKVSLRFDISHKILNLNSFFRDCVQRR